MKLPQYAICGLRPIKAIQTLEGGMDVLAYQWDTGEFKRDLSYLKIFAYLEDEDVEFVDYPEFERRVKELQKAR